MHSDSVVDSRYPHFEIGPFSWAQSSQVELHLCRISPKNFVNKDVGGHPRIRTRILQRRREDDESIRKMDGLSESA